MVWTARVIADILGVVLFFAILETEASRSGRCGSGDTAHHIVALDMLTRSTAVVVIALPLDDGPGRLLIRALRLSLCCVLPSQRSRACLRDLRRD